MVNIGFRRLDLDFVRFAEEPPNEKSMVDCDLILDCLLILPDIRRE
jgi:hypothetical protein